jgi:hypothetical protein
MFLNRVTHLPEVGYSVCKDTRWYDTCFILGQHAGLDFNCPCTQSNRPQEDESPYSETFCPPVTFSLLLNTTHFTEEGPWTILALSWPSACYKVSLYNKDVKFFHQTEHLTVWTSPSSSPHKQKWYQIIRNEWLGDRMFLNRVTHLPEVGYSVCKDN